MRSGQATVAGVLLVAWLSAGLAQAAAVEPDAQERARPSPVSVEPIVLAPPPDLAPALPETTASPPASVAAPSASETSHETNAKTAPLWATMQGQSAPVLANAADAAAPAIAPTVAATRHAGVLCRQRESHAQPVLSEARQRFHSDWLQDACRVLPADRAPLARGTTRDVPAAAPTREEPAAAPTWLANAASEGSLEGAASGRERPPAAAPAGPGLSAQTRAMAGTGLGADAVPFALLAGSALLLAWALYRRLSREDVFSSSTRQAVYERVLAKPGTTAGSLAASLGVEHRTVVHHLRVLREFHLVEASRVGARVRYFRNGGSFPEAKRREAVALLHPASRRVLDALSVDPGQSLSGLAAATGLPRSTARWHRDRLRAFGLLAKSDRSS
ncbi:MAG TPA: helix-turn-helix domain-containing protein [Candidatus Thermoplasmatota archaeon]|nr:helix-turn-helix domain-containing protein [Candidatus Thermoplasmatota archaeon]